MYCKECGSNVTNTDRFCPACGTPNVSHKFHPKFAPEVKVFEPKVLTEIAPAGSPSCPRCHRHIERSEEYCPGCGMELEAAWERLDRVTVLDAWRSQRGMELVEYRSARWFGEPLLAVLSIGVVLSIAIGVTNLWLYARGEGTLRSGPADATMWTALDIATTVAVGCFVLGGLLTVAWLWRSYRNLSALAVGDLRFQTVWAVIGWVVPGFNFFRPKQILDDVWRGSHPHAPPFSSSWRVGPVPAWSAAWWTSAWLGGLVALASRLQTPAAGTINSADQQSALALAGVAGLLLAGSALCLQLLVRRISDRQELRAEIVRSIDAPEQLEVVEPIDLDNTSLMRESVTMDGVSGKY